MAITYVILTPGDVAVGTMQADEAPTVDLLADELAAFWGFEDRDALLFHYPSLILGFATVH
jgi:hypothetical protein